MVVLQFMGRISIKPSGTALLHAITCNYAGALYLVNFEFVRSSIASTNGPCRQIGKTGSTLIQLDKILICVASTRLIYIVSERPCLNRDCGDQ